MLLSDREIKALAAQGVISPFVDTPTRERNGEKAVSFGPTPYGYDLRCQPKFWLFSPCEDLLGLDPKSFPKKAMRVIESDAIWVPAHSFVMTHAIERFAMPNDLTGLVVGKSTYARCALNVMVTVIHPGWSGELVLEFANLAPFPVRLYAHEGCAVLLLFRGDAPPLSTYTGTNTIQDPSVPLLPGMLQR